MNGLYDICIYCAAPGCEDGTAQHGAWCPSVTGVYPVTKDDVDKGVCCTRCDTTFTIDSEGNGYYALLRTERSNLFEVVCLGCKVTLEERAV